MMPQGPAGPCVANRPAHRPADGPNRPARITRPARVTVALSHRPVSDRSVVGGQGRAAGLGPTRFGRTAGLSYPCCRGRASDRDGPP